jgi:hypothetical protein
MPNETRHSIRIPIPAEQQTAALRIGREEMEVRLLNVSSGGCSVQVDRSVQVELGEQVQVRTAAGWTAAKVVSNSHDEVGNFLGLQWLCDVAVRTEAKKRRAGRRGLFTSLSIELSVLALLAGTGWAAILVLQQFTDPVAKADPVSEEQEQQEYTAHPRRHISCRRDAALGVRNAVLQTLRDPTVSARLQLNDVQAKQVRVVLDESFVAYLREADLLPPETELPREVK